jgi:hypothetical protein
MDSTCEVVGRELVEDYDRYWRVWHVSPPPGRFFRVTSEEWVLPEDPDNFPERHVYAWEADPDGPEA